MFMTSRESAIVLFPSPHNRAHTSRPCQPIWANLGRKSLASNRVRVNFGVQSIAQPGKTRRQGEFPCFTGFFAVFLDCAAEGSAIRVYILRVLHDATQYGVPPMHFFTVSPTASN